MPFFVYDDLAIAGVGSAVPKTEVSVDDFAPRFGESNVRKFKRMTGIEKARRSQEHQTASDLGFVAADRLVSQLGVNREEIGALVFVSHSTDYRRPATSCVLHKRLGLAKECAAIDISLGCSAFVYGLQAVCGMLASSDIEHGLLIVGETVSKMVGPDDRTTAMIFGDAGGAALISRRKGSRISALLRSDGAGYRAIIAPAGGFRNRFADDSVQIWADGNPKSLYNLHMDGNAVFNFTLSDVPRAIHDFWQRSGTSKDDFHCYVLHQANRFIHTQLAKKLGVPLEKMPLSLDRYGNTSAASIPVTLSDRFGASDGGQQKVLMSGFGVGLSWGVASAVIDEATILPIIESDEFFQEGVINSPADMVNPGAST